MKLVELENICVNYDGLVVLDHISFSIKKGEIITIIGPNGSGKTTLAKVVMGITPYAHGSRLISQDLKIGYMPQKLFISPELPITVRRFLELAADYNQKVIDDTSIAGLMERQLCNISGGEMQRVMLARSLLTNPNLLVLDEPTQGVDIHGQAEFYELIAEIRNKKDIAIMMISHDLYMVMKATDHVLCLNHHICCHGNPEDISKHPSYLELFGPKTSATMALYSHHHDHSHG